MHSGMDSALKSKEEYKKTISKPSCFGVFPRNMGQVIKRKWRSWLGQYPKLGKLSDESSVRKMKMRVMRNHLKEIFPFATRAIAEQEAGHGAEEGAGFEE